jgi:hypothetical protein
LSWSVFTSSFWMSLLSCPLRKESFIIISCSIRSIQIFITHISNSARERSSASGPIDRFSRWTHMIDSKIDLVSRILFGYWQFSVLRKIDTGPRTFRHPVYAFSWFFLDISRNQTTVWEAVVNRWSHSKVMVFSVPSVIYAFWWIETSSQQIIVTKLVDFILIRNLEISTKNDRHSIFLFHSCAAESPGLRIFLPISILLQSTHWSLYWVGGNFDRRNCTPMKSIPIETAW